MKKRNIKFGYTLAEIMVVLIVLGVVVTLIVPSTIKRVRANMNKTKIKKAMANYENILNKIAVENQLKSNKALVDFSSNNCENTSKYFKIVDGEGCKFKTADGLWWDISEIGQPIVAQKYEYLNDDYASSTTNKESFYFLGRYDNNGILRIDDNSYEYKQKANEYNIDITTKLYSYVENFVDECITPACKAKRGYSTACSNDYKSCTKINEQDKTVYDENGNEIFKTNGCDYGTGENCTGSSVYKYNKNGQLTKYRSGCDSNGINCKGTSESRSYNDAKNLTTVKINCDQNGENCKNISELHEYNDKNQNIITKYSCDSNGNNCETSKKYEYDLANNNIKEYSCNGKGEQCSSDYIKHEYNKANEKTKDYTCTSSGYCTVTKVWKDTTTSCDSNGQNCTTDYNYNPNTTTEYDSNGNIINNTNNNENPIIYNRTYNNDNYNTNTYNCDKNGQNCTNSNNYNSGNNYQYDNNGNRINNSYYEYDQNGNRIIKNY